MPRARVNSRAQQIRNQPYSASSRNQRRVLGERRNRRLSDDLRTPPILSGRFNFPNGNEIEEDDDSTDIDEQNDGERESDDATDADDDDDVTDAENEEDEDETDSFIVPDSQDSDSSDAPGSPTQASSPAHPQVNVSVDHVINISDSSVPNARQNVSNHDDIYEGELSPVEIIEPEPVKPVFRPDPQSPENLNETLSDDRNTCVICCEGLMSDGKHEIVVLIGCGHIFGRSCILEWIKKGKKECPNCKKKTKNSDVRKIYPATMPLVVRDNSENEGLRKKIEEMRRLSDELQRKLSISESQLKQYKDDLKNKEQEIRHLRLNRKNENISTSQSEAAINFKFEFLKEETLLSPGSNDVCRVLAVDHPTQTRSMCVAAALGTSNNFSQIASFTHGVYQIDLENLKKGKFIPLHKDEIKDMEFGSGYLLTGSADKSLKLVDTSINRINSTYVCESPIWSVTWNRGKHRVYAGTNKGEIHEFDTRVNNKDPVRVLKCPKRMPIHSLYFKNNGLLVGQYKDIHYMGLEDSQPTNVVLECSGNSRCMSMHIHNDHLLVTFRDKPPKTQFLSLNFSTTAQKRVLNASTVTEFVVGPQHDKITKDKLYSIHGETIAACSNQQGGNICLYRPTTAEIVQSFPRTRNAILDSTLFHVGETPYLAELTGKSVRFHKCST